MSMDVIAYQCHLGGLGYYQLRRKDGTLAIDGIPGPSTQSAIRKFQVEHQKRPDGSLLDPDGYWGPATETALREVIGSNEAPQEITAPNEPEEQAPAAPPTDYPSVWDEPDVKPYFSKAEFACPCPRCGGFPVEPVSLLVRCCAAVRKEANRIKPGTVFKISSGVRCQAHNDELPGSVPDSRHIRGRAVDFKLPGFTPQETLRIAKATPGIVYAYIMSSGWVHMDVGN